MAKTNKIKAINIALNPYVLVIWTKKWSTIGDIEVILMICIDIHIHGIGGYDTRTDSQGNILRIAEILGSQGVSEIILTIYPSSINEMRENMFTVRKAMERQRSAISSLQSAPSPPYKGGVQRREQKMAKAVTDAHGKLQGDSMTIVESAERLVNVGFNEEIILNCITKNPAKYLSV